MCPGLDPTTHHFTVHTRSRLWRVGWIHIIYMLKQAPCISITANKGIKYFHPVMDEVAHTSLPVHFFKQTQTSLSKYECVCLPSTDSFGALFASCKMPLQSSV